MNIPLALAPFMEARTEESVRVSARTGLQGVLPSAAGAVEIDAILRGVQRSTARLWVVNRDYRVLALAGKLARAPEPGGGKEPTILRYPRS